MHYVDVGEGRPLVLVHGNPTWSFLQRHLVQALAPAGFRCIAPDLLGYGLSDHPTSVVPTARLQADCVASLVESLGLEDVVVFGQDWGGPIGLGAARIVATRVSGLALGSTFAWRTDGIVRFVGRILRTRLVQRWMIRGEGFTRRVMRLLAQRPLSDDVLRHYTGVRATPALRASGAVLPRELLDADDWLAGLERDVRRLFADTPTLLFHGLREGHLGRVAVRRLALLLPRHQVTELPGAGHFFQEDAPAETAGALLALFGNADRLGRGRRK